MFHLENTETPQKKRPWARLDPTALLLGDGCTGQQGGRIPLTQRSHLTALLCSGFHWCQLCFSCRLSQSLLINQTSWWPSDSLMTFRLHEDLLITQIPCRSPLSPEILMISLHEFDVCPYCLSIQCCLELFSVVVIPKKKNMAGCSLCFTEVILNVKRWEIMSII